MRSKANRQTPSSGDSKDDNSQSGSSVIVTGIIPEKEPNCQTITYLCPSCGQSATKGDCPDFEMLPHLPNDPTITYSNSLWRLGNGWLAARLDRISGIGRGTGLTAFVNPFGELRVIEQSGKEWLDFSSEERTKVESHYIRFKVSAIRAALERER